MHRASYLDPHPAFPLIAKLGGAVTMMDLNVTPSDPNTMKIRALQLLVIGVVSFAAITRAAAVSSPGDIVFINEIHYDNFGTDLGEFVEVAGPAGTGLTGWSIVLYNGASPFVAYRTDFLSGSIPNQSNGYGTTAINYSSGRIQNGSPDGVALINASSTLVQFLSYEGVLTASGGAANGRTSTDIGVSESGADPEGRSLSLVGVGATYGDFTWSLSGAASPGTINSVQIFDDRLLGDYNNNGKVDASDYVLWRNGGPLLNDATAGVQSSDYGVWRSHFGESLGSAASIDAIPEPSAYLLMLAAVVACQTPGWKANRRSVTERNAQITTLVILDWFPVFLFTTFAVVASLPYRFSLPTLLIAATFVAGVLGVVVWAE